MRQGIVFHEVEQGSPEWFALRLGRVTGTSAAELLVNGKGADGIGAGAWSLIYQLAGEIVTGETPPDFNNYWTERGKEMESQAIEAYMEETFHQANRVGFISYGKYAGCSPDFMVDDKRGGEVKCLSAREHFRYCHTRKIEKDYFAQVQWCLFVTGFEVWDYIHYHPNAGVWSLVIDEIKPDMEMHAIFSERLGLLATRVEEIVNMAQPKHETI